VPDKTRGVTVTEKQRKTINEVKHGKFMHTYELNGSRLTTTL